MLFGVLAVMPGTHGARFRSRSGPAHFQPPQRLIFEIDAIARSQTAMTAVSFSFLDRGRSGACGVMSSEGEAAFPTQQQKVDRKNASTYCE
jgi:hypothetical protein